MYIKTSNCKKNKASIFNLTAQYFEKYSSPGQQLTHRGWHRVNRQEELLEKGEEVGDGRAERLSAAGDRRQAAIPITSDIDGTHVSIFKSSQLEGSFVGDLLYRCYGCIY